MVALMSWHRCRFSHNLKPAPSCLFFYFCFLFCVFLHCGPNRSTTAQPLSQPSLTTVDIDVVDACKAAKVSCQANFHCCSGLCGLDGLCSSGCLGVAETCENGAQCCSGNCHEDRCCGGGNAVCTKNIDCCFGVCGSNGLCLTRLPYNAIADQFSSVCLETGGQCSTFRECCSNRCRNDRCCPVEPHSKCTHDYECCLGRCGTDGTCESGGTNCNPFSQNCSNSSECCDGICQDGRCGCKVEGSVCSANVQCCSGDCGSGGVCQKPAICRNSGLFYPVMNNSKCRENEQCCSGRCDEYNACCTNLGDDCLKDFRNLPCCLGLGISCNRKVGRCCLNERATVACKTDKECCSDKCDVSTEKWNGKRSWR